MEERDLNSEILVPFETAMAQFGETTRRVGAGSRELVKMQYSGFYVHIDDIDTVLPVSKMVERVLEHNHANMDYEVKVPLARLELGTALFAFVGSMALTKFLLRGEVIEP